MKESDIEKFLCKQVSEKLGGKVLKFNSLSMNGMPDRIVFLPEGVVFFVELKAFGKKPRPLQRAAHRMLRKLGQKVYVIDSKEGVIELVEFYATQISKDGNRAHTEEP